MERGERVCLRDIWNEETTMLIGYARTSTLEQEAGLEAQFRDLQALACEKVIKEQTSSVGPRRGLEEAMEFVRSGDTLVGHEARQAGPQRPAHVGDHWSPQGEGRCAPHPQLGDRHEHANRQAHAQRDRGVAEFEREIMVEGQREGNRKAEAEGKEKGPQPTARAKTDEIKALAAQNL